MNFANSIEAFERAKKSIPGGVNSPVRAFSSVGGTPPFIARGEGAYLIDIDGNKFIDYIQSWGPLILGHSNERVINKLKDAVYRGFSYGAPTVAETELAEKIKYLFPHVELLRFVSSGTEAVMSAIRVARGYTNKNDIIKFEGNYHGHSDSLLVKAGSGATTFGSPSSAGVPESFTKHTYLAKYNNIQSVKNAFESSQTNSGGIACVIIEPIAGNMGLVPAELEFLQELRTLCDKNSAVLIFDEVMSGFRADLRGAFGLTNIKADLITFGKVIGGGMPVGAFGGRADIMQKLSPLGNVYQAGTLSGNPLAMAVGNETLDILLENQNIYKILNSRAETLMNGFKKSADKNRIPLQIDVRGSMFGFFFNSQKVKNFDDALKSDTVRFAKFYRAMLELGIYLAPSQFEAGFISVSIDENIIQETIAKADEVMANL